MRRLAQYLAYLAIRLVICVTQALPLRACESAANLLAILFNDLLRIRRRTTEENLRHAFPQFNEAQRRELALQMWRHLFLFAAEVAHTPRKIHPTNWKQYVTLHGEDLLVRQLLDDRPLVMVTGHLGNFELSTYLLSLFGYRIHSVARTLDNPYLDSFVNRFRSSTGQTILTKKGDYDRIVDILAAGGTLGFVADQYAGTKGCWVEFFGRPASAHKAIALFALNHDAPVFVGTCLRLGEPLHYRLAVQGIVDPRDDRPEVAGVRELTQWFTSQLEQAIRTAPDQYWWLHRRWKDHRPQKKTRK